jgi:hypothetical protein
MVVEQLNEFAKSKIALIDAAKAVLPCNIFLHRLFPMKKNE